MDGGGGASDLLPHFHPFPGVAEATGGVLGLLSFHPEYE